RTTLMEYLRYQRLTLELKCSGLDATDLARRSVEPSTLSLLGLVRHMAEVERTWFRRRMAGQDVPRLFGERDADFDGAVPDPEVVAQAWELWRADAEVSNGYFPDVAGMVRAAEGPGVGAVSAGGGLVFLVEEYAPAN